MGRVLRPSPGKRVGSIIVPVALPDGADDDTELLLSRFSLLWSVLRGLRSHDQRFAAEIDQAVRGYVRHGNWGYRPERLDFVLPDGMDEQLQLRLVQEVGDAWERFFTACQVWAFRHPGRRLPWAAQVDGLAIGAWAVKQRAVHAKGVLPPERARRLEEVPEWYWDRADAAWADTYAILQAFGEAYGTVAENPAPPSVYAGLRAGPPQRERLGVWLAVQRQAHRDGTLDPARAALLEALPGWTWHPVPAEDLGHVDALRQFVEFEHQAATIPDGHVEDGLSLGRWVWDVRRRNLTGVLHPALEDEIWAATPSQWRVGARTRWQWEKPETQWRLAFTALRQYVGREGHSRPTTAAREALSDGRVNVGQWVAMQRHLQRKGELDPRRAAALERLPGWSWDGDVGGTRPFEEPLRLSAQLTHGSAGAIARGCHCEPCGTAARAKQNEWRARRRAQELAGGVPSGRAARHLQRLEGQLRDRLPDDTRRDGAGRTVVATTSGVPLRVLRGLAAGSLPRISRDHEARLLATTAAACLSNFTNGSRGRPTQRGGERVDVAGTKELIRDLQGRGFDLGWIGRELGYTKSLQVTGDTVTRRVADQVAELHAAVGDMVAPPRRHAHSVPRLSALQGPQEVA